MSDDERSFIADIAEYNSTRNSSFLLSSLNIQPFRQAAIMDDDKPLPNAALASTTASAAVSAPQVSPISRAEWTALGRPRCTCGITHPPPCDPDRVASGRVNKSLGYAPKSSKKRKSKSKSKVDRKCFRCRGFHNTAACISTKCRQCQIIHKKGETCPVGAEYVERSVATRFFDLVDSNDAVVVSRARSSLEMHCRKNNLPLFFIDQIPRL